MKVTSLRGEEVGHILRTRAVTRTFGRNEIITVHPSSVPAT